MGCGWIGIGLLALGQVVPAPRTGEGVGAALRAEARTIRADEARQLEELASSLEKKGQADRARAVRAHVEPPPPDGGPERFPPLPEVVPARREGQSPTVDDDRAIRAEAARKFFELACRAGSPSNERFGVAAECLRGVLARDPDHREARRLLGFVAHDGGWATPHAAKNLQDGFVLDANYGWVPADWVPHLKRGELPGIAAEGQPVPWLPAAEADELRHDFAKRPWRITTAHFEIATNVPLAEAIAFGHRLETLRDVFFTVLADALDPASLPLAARFRDPQRWAEVDTKRHQVWYFAEREEYIGYFRRRFRRDESVSLGFYMTPFEASRLKDQPRSYFYRDRENAIDVTATLYHEVSHQLLFETAGPTAGQANVGQYWVWEGLGTYFETFVTGPDGSCAIGGQVGPRMASARTLAADSRLMPLEAFVRMGESTYKRRPGVYDHYPQGMALAVFLMHAEGGRHRDAFLDYVRDAYRGQFRGSAGGRSLADRLGVPYRTLDERFRAFLTEPLPGGRAG